MSRKDLNSLVEPLIPSLTELRREFHANPELSFQEHETSARILRELENLPGIEIQTAVANTGLVAVFGADKPGPCVALRADMDALPIEEQSGKSYASKNPGCMHACGHDGHMTCLIGAAKVLSQIADSLPGPVKLLFQPAEEFGHGARCMCEAGVLEKPDVQAIFALHCNPLLPLGQIGVRSGPTMAAVDNFRVVVSGQGTHAAAPHLGIDPILVASHIVLALQSIVSRSTDPLDSLVLTVGQIHAGTAPNIIPQTAEIEGTLRTLRSELRESTFQRVEKLAKGTAESFGAQAEVEIRTGYPVLVNEEYAVDLVKKTGQEVLGPSGLFQPVPPIMASEDFAYYAQQVPAAYWYLGLRPPEAVQFPMVHDAKFDFVDQAIPVGVKMHCEIVRSFMKQCG